MRASSSTSIPRCRREWLNTIDTSKPSSRVDAVGLVPADPTRIAAHWSGSDEGAGISKFLIYVSDDSGPYSLRRVSEAQQDTFRDRTGTPTALQHRAGPGR